MVFFFARENWLRGCGNQFSSLFTECVYVSVCDWGKPLIVVVVVVVVIVAFVVVAGLLIVGSNVYRTINICGSLRIRWGA